MWGCSEGRVEVAERFSLSEKAAGADPDSQSSNSSGSDGSNTKSGTGSASEGSKAGVWSRRKSPCGGPRAGEIGGGVCGSSRCWRHGVWRSGLGRRGTDGGGHVGVVRSERAAR